MSTAKSRKAQPRSFNWKYEQEIKLIETIRENPCLWDSRSPFYHRKHLRQTKLAAIAAGIHPDLIGDAVQARFRNIRIVFARELRKHLDSIRSGMGTDDVYESRYNHFTRMMFIKDSLNPIKRRPSMVNCNCRFTCTRENAKFKLIKEKDDDNSSLATESSLMPVEIMPTMDDVLDESETLQPSLESGKKPFCSPSKSVRKMNLKESQVSEQNELVSTTAITVLKTPVKCSDVDEIFCKLLASELKEMPDQKRDFYARNSTNLV